MAFVFLWFPSCSMIIYKSIHVAANGISSFLFYGWVICHPVCVYVCVSIYVHIQINIFHILFIHSSVAEHLGCFHVLAIITSATVNIGVNVSFQIKSFLWYIWASQGVLEVKNLLANAGDIRDLGSIPGLGRSPGGGHGNPLQYSCLGNPHG